MALISFYLIVVVVRYFKERNEYLRDIRDELRLMNSKQK
jgi:CTP:phosphocholine cytidylyltransferase-like protein